MKKTKKVTIPDLKKKIEEIAIKQSESFIEGLDERVSKMLDSAMYSLLGLENRWGNKTEIDHCNGRNSVLIDIIRDKAKREVERIVKKVGFNKGDVPNIRKAFTDEYKSQVRQQIRMYAESTAKSHVKAAVELAADRHLKTLGVE